MIRRSVFGRVMAACLLSFATGAVTFTLGWPYLRSLWLSVFSDHRICEYAINQDEYMLVRCTPWQTSMVVLLVTTMLVSLALLLWAFRSVARGINRPIEDMTDTVRQLGPQNLGQRVRYRGFHEVRTLADTLNDMLDRVATGYEGQRRFASNASHELRTPLAVQRTLVEVAMVTGEQDLSRLAAQLLAVNERNEQLIEGLLVLAESDRGLPGTEPVRLDLLVGEVLDRYAEQAAEHRVALTRGTVDRTVSGDPVLLDRMVSNLVHNAIKYNEPGGTVDVVVAVEPALSVHNSGQHVPAEAVPALFEPFRRRSAERTNHRDGAGLGLSIVRSIAAAHRGSVSASPGDHGGLRVTVDLPQSANRDRSAPAARR